MIHRWRNWEMWMSFSAIYGPFRQGPEICPHVTTGLVHCPAMMAAQ
jgi:hypothetical protein